MFAAEVRFPLLRSARKCDSADVLESLIFLYHHNGQISTVEWPSAVSGGTLRVFVSIPERTSLRRRTNRWVRQCRRRLRGAGLGLPRILVLGEEPESSPVCECRSCRSYILHTEAYSCESPVRCGTCFGVIPLYRLPPTNDYGSYDNTVRWRANYQAYDGLWFRTRGAQEKHAYRQLAHVDSALSREGRAVCRAIEQGTRRRTYYYLFRYSGRSRERELASTCASCGRAWRLDKPWHEEFDFRCERCRLVSAIACDVR